MNFKAKSSNVTKSLYIILILCIISVVGLSIYAFFIQKGSPNNLNSLDNSAQITTTADRNDELRRIFGTTESPTTPTQPLNDSTPVTPNAEVNTPNQPIQSPAEKTAGDGVSGASDISGETPAQQSAVADSEQQAAAADGADESDNAAALEVSAVPTFFLKPIAGTVSKIYNSDTPEFSVVMNDYRTHTGIDIESEIGTNVKSVADGTVAEIIDDPMMGKTVVISHSGGIQSLYMNLQEHVPKNIVVGAEVKAGDVIGGVGESSLIELSDVPHLHFAMKKDGEFVDPAAYIEY